MPHNGKAIRQAIVDRTKQIRQKRGLSPSFVADYLGVPLPTFTKWEGARGPDSLQTTMPDEYKAKFAELTGCDLHHLITGKHKRPARNP